jgi:hypothetical protein
MTSSTGATISTAKGPEADADAAVVAEPSRRCNRAFAALSLPRPERASGKIILDDMTFA